MSYANSAGPALTRPRAARAPGAAEDLRVQGRLVSPARPLPRGAWRLPGHVVADELGYSDSSPIPRTAVAPLVNTRP